jgi:aryl-alcohol dehydrogenase-like predicted oxidoreductase
MNHRTLGRTGLRCSEIGLGTWAFASQIYGDVEQADASNTIRTALDAGVTFFDTAPLYGSKERDGIAEEILGKGLDQRRSEVILSTKFGRNSTEGNTPNFHAQRARESVEASLNRLGTDYIDVLFFHSPFSASEIHDNVWEALGDLKKTGKIRFVGHSISMFDATQSMARAWASERKIDVIQVVYSLMNRQSAGLIDDLGTAGIGIVARECMANGFLSGGVTRDTVFPSGHLNARYPRAEIEARVDYIEAMDFLVREPIQNLPQAATRWVLDEPHVSLVLSGAMKAGELLDAVHASASPPYSPEERGRAARLHTRDFEAA